MNRRSRKAYFYREVLGPSDLNKIKADLLMSRDHRADSAIMESTSDRAKTAFADRIGNLREFTGFALAAEMTDAFAELIVDEYLWCREVHVVTKETAANYTKKAGNLLERYRSGQGFVLLDELSPVTAVMCLFEQSKELKPAAWQQYRSALLSEFRKTRAYQIRQSGEHKAYDRAIALLAVVNEPPYVDERAPEKSADRRKGVPAADYEAVLRRLELSPVNRSMTAMNFAIVTLATGLRPGEWADACLVESADSGEIESTMLRVRSAKAKVNDEDVYRTLVLTTSEVEAVVRRHLWNVWAEIEAADPAWRVAPLDNLIKKCSERIKDECKKLWPSNRERWFTLYSLRQQAAGNFKKTYGKAVAAGMLGHSEKVSRGHYAHMNRAYKGWTSEIAPGPDVIERIQAKWAANERQDKAARPWERGANEERGPDVDEPDQDSEGGDRPSQH